MEERGVKEVIANLYKKKMGRRRVKKREDWLEGN
jgi:hypothetical protein